MYTVQTTRTLAWLLAGTITAAATMRSNASELMSLLEVLRENGTITEAQYQRLRNEALAGSQTKPMQPVTTEDTDSERAEKLSDTARTPSVHAKFGKTGGLTLKHSGRAFELTLGGRLFVDAVSYREDREPLGSGTELRAARLSLKGSLGDDWKFKAQYDFAEDDLSVKDVYLRYTGFRHLDGVTIGHFKEPFSLEDQTSSKQITFMERALPVDAFSPGRALGVGIDRHGKSWSLGAGLFAESVGDVPADEGNEGWGLAARGTLALLHDTRRSLHIGVAGEYRQPNSDGEVRYRAGPESHLTSVSLVSTGRIEAVDHTRILGLEAALVEGPFSLQGELIHAQIERDRGNTSLDFNGWYLYGSWMLTGEARPYSPADGTFDRVIPQGTGGAWELGLRYSSLDLDDRDILGGTADSVTLGLNWYLNPRIRFMANYIRVDSKRGGVKDDPDIFQVRSQLVF